MRPSILILTEHRGELQPFIDKFRPVSEGKGYRLSLPEGDLFFCSNRGRGGMEMTHLLYGLLRENEFQIVVNAGLCGALNPGCAPGVILTAAGGMMADLRHEKVLGPYIEAPLQGNHSRRLITLPLFQPGAYEKALVWGSLVDREGYYILSWGRANRVPVLLYKMVSDNNVDIPIEPDVDPAPMAARFQQDLPILQELAGDVLHLEALLRLALPLEKSGEARKWAEKCREERLSFTRRHQLYQSLKLEKDIQGSASADKSCRRFLFLEEDIRDKERFEAAFPEYKPFAVRSYLDYFQSPRNEGCSALFIARKKGELVRLKPEQYGRPGWRHYSAFNGYNCPMDCTYCFLQGYFKNPSPVLFLNREELFEEMKKKAEEEDMPVLFHFGDLCDGAAFDRVTQNIAWFSEKIIGQNWIYCEFRMKSAALSHLEARSAHEHLIIGFSLAPQKAIERWERLTPSLHRRLEIARELADKGFRLSFHLDPVIIQTQKEWADYEDLARLLRDEWGKKGLFSVSMGTLRMKRDTFRAIRDKGRGALLKGLALGEGFYRYPGDVRREADERLGKVLEEGFGGCYYVCMD